MPRVRAQAAMWLAVVGILLLSSVSAVAATSSLQSDEVGGSSVAARLAAQNLRNTWAAQVAANGGTAAPPITFTQPTFTLNSPISGVVNTAADGTTLTIQRTRYTGDTNPTYVGASTNPGTAVCTTSGTSLQGGAPRPTSLVGNAACDTAAGFAYTAIGGAGDSTTRDAVELTFSRPVLGFGAWFGDVETRTDGFGVAAVVRLYGVDGVLLSDQLITPGPSYLPQSNCGGAYTGCGNNTTRWLGFVADPAEPVLRMVVIVGEDNANLTALDEGIGLIGPTMDLSTASISLTKSARPLADTNSDGVIGAGDTVSYEFAVTNTGTLAVSGVSVTDNFASGVSCPTGALAGGAVRTCTGSHVLTQAEVDAGSITNTARATAAAYGGTVTSAPSTAVVPITSSPGLRLSKSASSATFDTVGEQVRYELVAQNTGNVTLSGVSVTDTSPGNGAFSTDCGDVGGSLRPGDSATCTATYTVTQADLDAGTLTNDATADALAPGRIPVGPVAGTVTTTAIQRVGFTLQKAVDEQTFEDVGDVLTYTMTVTNSGNVTLTGVSLTDPAPGTGAFDSGCDSLAATLAPGRSDTCTATYTVTQDDLDAGSVVNLADAEAVSPGGPVTAPRATATSTVVERPGLGIVKTVDSPTFDAAGDQLTYSITVTNLGNVRVSTVRVTDAAPGAGAFNLDCSALPNALNSGASGSCTATYTVTQDDVDTGGVLNEAQASARLPSTQVVLSPTGSASSVAEQTAALSLVKTVDADSFDTVGDLLTYTLSVTNSGNVTLEDATVIDNAPGSGAFNLDCPNLPGDLAPGDVANCTATYAVTQADLDGGAVTNIASATAVSPGGSVTTPESLATVAAQQAPGLDVAKTVDATEFTRAGDVLNYSLTVNNNGNVTLTDVVVTDPAPGNGSFTLDCGDVPDVLAPGSVGTCSARYVVTQSDVDNGSVTNVATVDASAPGGRVSSTSPDVTSISLGAASMEVLKDVDLATYDAVGQLLVYTIIVNNTGDLTLTSVGVSDLAPGPGDFALDCVALTPELEPGHSGICQATYAVTQADLDAGLVLNTADASATPPRGDVLVSSASATSRADAQPALSLNKSVAERSFAKAGDVLNYTITTRNTGNVTLTNVKVKDKAPGRGDFTTSCGVIQTLPPGDSSVCTATYTVTTRDLAIGNVTNTAKASATNKVAATASAASEAKSGNSPGTGGGNGDGDGVLPDSGAPDIRLPVGLGIGLLLVGAVMSIVGWRRRRPFVRG